MNKSVSTKDMSREEWLKERQTGIGGSDAAAILGLNRWMTPLDVYNEKVAKEPVDRVPTPAMEFGILAEKLIADWWEKETSMKLREDHKIRRHPEYDFMLCNLDRSIVSVDGRGPGVWEAKSTHSYYMKTWDNEIPLEYYAQMQHNLFTTTWTWGELPILVVDERRFQRIPLHPDSKYQEIMLEKCQEFWTEHVLARVPPPAQTEEDLAKLYPVSAEGKEVPADNDTAATVYQVRELKAQVKELDSQMAPLVEQIKLFMKDAEVLTVGENILATWKTGQNPAFQTIASKVKAKNPGLWVRAASECDPMRSFRIKAKRS